MSTPPIATSSKHDIAPIPPTPPGLPYFGQLFDAWRNPLELFTRVRREHGRIVQLNFTSMRYVIVSSAEAAKHVLVDEHRKYRKSQNYDGLKFLLGTGLLTSEGDFWLKQRRLAQPAFHRDRLVALADTMVAETDRMLDRWSRIDARTQVDVHEAMMALTLQIVVRTLFGGDVPDTARIGAAVTTAIEWANHFVESFVRIPPRVPTARNREFNRAKRTLDGLVQELIDARRGSTHDRHDLLSMYMEVRDEDTGERMSDAQLRDEVMTLVLAGHETTANALSWALYLLARHPAIERRLLTEITAAVGDCAPTPADLRSMPLLGRVVDETMRLYPPAWMVERQANEDDVILGYRIEKDVIVGVSPYVLHRDPGYWENPEGFDPDRFLPERSVGRPKHAYMPFGAGPRLCIGNNFALMEAQLVLARILQRSAPRLAAGHRVEMDPSVTLRPLGGMKMTIVKRTHT